jgi:hypothetical protein
MLGAAAVVLGAETATKRASVFDETAEWPEQVGRGEPERVARQIATLGRLIDERAPHGLAFEARYRRALSRLEPTPSHDRASARAELVEVARGAPPPWDARARYALAWMRESEGLLEEAMEGYLRVLVDHPGGESQARSKAGLGRLALLDGRAGEAASLFDEAIAEGAPEESGAVLAREAAVRVLLRADAPLAGEARSLAIPLREVSAAVTGRDGFYLADRRAGQVIRLSDAGTVLDSWVWDVPVDALAADGSGHVGAAAGGSIWRLEPSGKTVETGQLGEYDPPGAFALGAGGAWVVDRRGQRLGRIDPGHFEPRTLAEDREGRIEALAWDGERLLGLDTRRQTVRVVWAARGAKDPQAAFVPGTRRPESLAVDPAGRWLVVEGRAAGLLRLFDREGALVADLPGDALGVERLAAAMFGRDGALHVVDDGGPTLKSWP